MAVLAIAQKPVLIDMVQRLNKVPMADTLILKKTG
jgi:hypothetical protein